MACQMMSSNLEKANIIEEQIDDHLINVAKTIRI